MACSWDPEMVQKVYRITSKEARARGFQMAYTPNADIGRDPRFGRIHETYGEDTYLTSRMIVAAVKGFQGNTQMPHFIATCKHFAGYGQVSGGKNFAPVEISPRTFIDEILPPFKAAVKEANLLGIMPSHCDVNGVPCHGNKELLTNILRKEWGFRGIIVSDADDILRLDYFQHVKKDTSEAVLQSLIAGIDLELGEGGCTKLIQIIQQNPKLESVLNETVKRLLTVKFQIDLFIDNFNVISNHIFDAIQYANARLFSLIAGRRIRMSCGTNHSNGMNTSCIERENMICVFQKHNGAFCSLLSKGKMFL